VTYLSSRMREIRAEDARRRGEMDPIPIGGGAVEKISVSDLVYGPMAMIDPEMQRLAGRAFDQYEQTLAARNPHMRESINFRGRAG
jgi:hypothetical protein